MIDLEHMTRRQHLLLAGCGGLAALAIFALDVTLALGLVVPIAYVGLLLAYHAARIERVYLFLGALSGALVLLGGYLGRGDALTLTELLDRLVFVAVLAALAVILSRALSYQRELRARSATDELTGVSQRDPFLEMVTKESLRAKRYRNPCSLAVFEIDNLREITTSHGRAARDRLIKSLAQTCADGIRPTDLVGRIDDRLVAGLPETREIDAAVVAERLRRAALEVEDRQEGGGGAVKFGVSVGIAAFTEDDDPFEVLERADAAVVQAQAAGGNRVSIAPDEIPAVA